MESTSTQSLSDGWEAFKLDPSTSTDAKVIVNIEQEESKARGGKGKGKSQRKFERLQDQVDEEVRAKWEAEQNALKEKLIEEDSFDWILDQDSSKSTLKYVGAIDISYSKNDQKKAVAALIVCEYPSMKVVYEDFERETADYPYIPGFLAFKEVPVYSILFDRLKENKPLLWP